MPSPIRDIDPALLRSFVLTAELSSMTLAARALYKTQGAVSQQIKRLEELLDVSLFHRDKARLRLSQSAEKLLPKARQLIKLQDELWLEMTQESVRGHVRFGVPHDLVTTWAIPVMKTYCHAFPAVEISLHPSSSPDLLDGLGRGEIDIAIIEQPLNAMTGELLRRDELVWIGALGGTAYQQSPIPLSMVIESCIFRQVTIDALEEQEIAHRFIFEAGSVEAMSATVGADLAISASLASMVPDQLEISATDRGLPKLPDFSISLNLSPLSTSEAVTELAHHIRQLAI